MSPQTWMVKRFLGPFKMGREDENLSQPETRQPLQGVGEDFLLLLPQSLGWVAPCAVLHTGAALQLFVVFYKFSETFLRLLPPTLFIQYKNVVSHVRWRLPGTKPPKITLCTQEIWNSRCLWGFGLAFQGSSLLPTRKAHGVQNPSRLWAAQATGKPPTPYVVMMSMGSTWDGAALPPLHLQARGPGGRIRFSRQALT